MKSQQGSWFPVILRLNLPSLNILPVADFCQMRKKKQNLKVENYVLFGGLFEDSNQEDSLSAPSNHHKEAREEPGAFATKNRGSEHLKKILLIKENQTSQVNEWVLFFVWEDVRVWAHWTHSFDRHLTIEDQYPAFLHPKSPQHAQLWMTSVPDGLMPATSFHLLIWQVTSFVHTALLGQWLR